ncbi:MAG: uroporphyrinogen-III synthase [Actinobacteria bacterium]|nr:uroporphyrinogen-III synthase [Actinomycetota bacterium]
MAAPRGAARGPGGDAAGARAAESLAGCCVLVTRAAHQAAALVEPLEALGAEVIAAPVIDIVEPEDWTPADEAISRLGTYDWVVFTSANAVEAFIGRIRDRGVGPELMGSARIAAVGPATAERLEEHGLRADTAPDDRRAEGLAAEFRAIGVGPGTSVLIPRAAVARDLLPDDLRRAGADVDVVAVYRTVPAVPDPSIVRRLVAGDIDAITFTSPSTVRHFTAWAEAAGVDVPALKQRTLAASIGPVTTDALVRHGYLRRAQADDSTSAGLVRAIDAACRRDC